MVTGLNIIGHNKALQDHEIKRIVAWIVDAIIVVLISWVVVAVLWFSLVAIGGFGTFFLGPGTLVIGLLGILYWSVLEGFMGATVGKRIMNLQVVSTAGPMDLPKAFLRNASKLHWVLALLDWLIGLGTEGDPRQKLTDRFAQTTVVRTDQQAYMEEQFRMMATPPPHPQAPQYGPDWQPGQQPPSATPPPGQQPPAQGWPGQQQPAPGSGWPQHKWDEQGQLVQQPRFCSSCGGPLVPRGDGRMVCSRCGTVY